MLLIACPTTTNPITISCLYLWRVIHEMYYVQNDSNLTEWGNLHQVLDAHITSSPSHLIRGNQQVT